MKIKYYHFQKWLLFVVILVPILLWSLSTHLNLDKYFEESKVYQSELEMDRLADQIFMSLENKLNYLNLLQKIYMLNDNIFNEKQMDIITFVDQVPKEDCVAIDLEHKEFKLAVNLPEMVGSLVQRIQFDTFYQTDKPYEILSNDDLKLELDKFQNIENHYYKAVYNKDLNLEIVIRSSIKNSNRQLHLIYLGILIVSNIVIYSVFNRILKNKNYPLNNLISTLKDILGGRLNANNTTMLGFNQPLDQLIKEIIEVEIDLKVQTQDLEASCEKYRENIDEILLRGKALKKEHDQFFTEMGTKEGLNDILFDTVNEIIILSNKQGKILEVNHAFENKLGFTKDEIVGESMVSILVDKSTVLEELTKSIEPVYLNLKMGSIDSEATQFLNFKIDELPNGNFLYIGKSIDEEIALQSRILRKNRELEYINQINSALINNLGLKELLINIINRIDYLFNIVSGTIRIKNDDGFWELKAKSEKGDFYHDTFVENINDYYGSDVASNSEIKIIEMSDLYRENHCYSKDLTQLLIAPMEVESEIISILSIAIDHTLTANDINILKMFKNQASVVIQRALLYDQLRKQYLNTIQALVNVIEAKDKYTEGHSRRVSRFSVEIASEMGYSNEELENIEIAGLLHDVGKVGIHQSILTKRGRLSDEEYEIIKEHPEKGIQILKSIKLDAPILDAILYHHVRYDLKGYPVKHNLEELPQYAGIIGVADAFDAITSERSYSKAETIYEGLKELIRNSGTQFAPIIIDAFEKIVMHNPDKLQNIIDDI